jgi:metal-responsive CopG/Arc/MetJ family transcriptional regulator
MLIMPNVKRTFTLPDEVSTQLNEVIPNKERSKFISSSLREALRERKKNDLLSLLANMPRKENPNDLKSEEILSEIRSCRANEIIANS